MRLKRIIFAAGSSILCIGLLMLLARIITPSIGGVWIVAVSGFSALSTAFGFQILSLRREVLRTEGLDEERRVLLRRRLDRSLKTLFFRWSLSFTCGIFGTAFGLIIREAKPVDETWLLIVAGLSSCAGSVFFLFLMILEYRSLLQFSTELEDRAEQLEQRRQWAERMEKIARR
jgi:hypothetical protein